MPLDFVFCLRVDRGSRFVQNENTWIADKGPGNEMLAFTS